MSIGVIVDLDGTFVDTNEARASAWVETLKENDYHVGFAEVRPLIGLHPHEILIRTIGFGVDTDLGQQVRDRASDILRKRYMKNLTPFYGAPELLHLMRANGLRVVVSSFDHTEVLSPLLRLVSAEALIADAVHGDNLLDARTNRDVLRAAMERASTPSGRMVLITDSPHDVEAAKKLGLPSIAFRSGRFTDGKIEANLVFDNAMDLLQQYEQSPLSA